jgi:hypothetical protein
MITPNGGVFGRNPKFNNVTVDGNLTVNGDLALGDDITVNDTLTVNGLADFNGGLKVTPNAVAPESNVTIGPSAGANLVADSVGNVLLGSGAGDVLGASGRNVAIGTDALGAFSAGAASITNTTPGTGGTGAPTTYNNILLEKDSGVGEMAVYPTVNLRVSTGGAVDFITIVSPGSGATVASGIVLRAVTTPAGVPTNWRGTLASITGDNIAIGHNAGLLQTTGNNNTLVGSRAGDAITTGTFNCAVGIDALGANTTGSFNCAFGRNALLQNTTGGGNIAIAESAMLQNTTGSNNVSIGAETMAFGGGSSNAAVGVQALRHSTGNSNCAIGNSAGRYRGTGTDTLTSATSSVFIGHQSRAAGNSETNQVVIGGVDAVGNGSNTTTLGNADTTGTFIAGTATSRFSVAGDTMRIVGTRTPASNAAGTAGDFAFGTDGGTTYLYYCIASGNWGRVALTTGY